MLNKWILSFIALFGALCIGIGIYMLFYPKQEAPVAIQPEIQNTIQSTQSTPQSQDIIVKGTDKWKDSGITVKKGQRIIISASGSVTWDKDLPAVNPDGTFPYGNILSFEKV